MTPERKAQILRELEPILGPPPVPKPKVVTRSDVGTIRDADVHVSRADPNAVDGQEMKVEVRRPDWVKINMAAYEAQRADEAADRRRDRELDPYKLGLYGPVDDES
jgi:hypothetical protein